MAQCSQGDIAHKDLQHLFLLNEQINDGKFCRVRDVCEATPRGWPEEILQLEEATVSLRLLWILLFQLREQGLFRE